MWRFGREVRVSDCWRRWASLAGGGAMILEVRLSIRKERGWLRLDWRSGSGIRWPESWLKRLRMVKVWGWLVRVRGMARRGEDTEGGKGVNGVGGACSETGSAADSAYGGFVALSSLRSSRLRLCRRRMISGSASEGQLTMISLS